MTPEATAVDKRLEAFSEPEGPEVFHAIAHQQQIWEADPFDVPTIHGNARELFEELLRRSSAIPQPSFGRSLLLRGAAGSGKTHLLRAFRQFAHSSGLGYVCYMQMNSYMSNYGRYVLSNVIESLDNPYVPEESGRTGLMRLSDKLLSLTQSRATSTLDLLCANGSNQEIDERVDLVTDWLIQHVEGLHDIELDLIRCLLYLQRNEPVRKARVMKYLRCEDLAARDRDFLGGIVPRTAEDDPQRMVEMLGRLMHVCGPASLVLCLDQLEDMYTNDEGSEERFRNAMRTVREIGDRVPSSVTVVACLADSYTVLRNTLPRSLVDRLEQDPAPVDLFPGRTYEEIEEIVATRLRYLFTELGVEWLASEPVHPFNPDELRELVNQGMRTVLNCCHEAQRNAFQGGPVTLAAQDAGLATEAPDNWTRLESLWNDFRAAFRESPPTGGAERTDLLLWAVSAAADELPAENAIRARPVDDMIEVATGDGSPMLACVCEQDPRGGGLGNRIEAARLRAGGRPLVLVRSSTFPSNPGTQIATIIGRTIAQGGRRVVVEKSTWRTMMCLRSFRAQREADADWLAWLRYGRPLTRLTEVRAILNMDAWERHEAPLPSGSRNQTKDQVEKVVAPPKAITRPVVQDPLPALAGSPMVLGEFDTRAGGPFEFPPSALLRHAAVLGGTGSGKTTLALNLIEGLLERGIPAVLIDRKGDLCSYATDTAWNAPLDTEAAQARRAQLRQRVDVQLYTPGDARGRGLGFAVVPTGLAPQSESDRMEAALQAASALGHMMNYGTSKKDRACTTILAYAIKTLAEGAPQSSGGVRDLIEFIDERDPSLLAAIGKLDARHFKTLVEDLECLSVHVGGLLAEGTEGLNVSSLFKPSDSGRVPLTIVSLRFLRDEAQILFWVARFLGELGRFAAQSPSPDLQGVVLLDEADLYLPATSKPPTKAPLESGLRRFRSAGIGLMLATQSPGDLDYRSRENIGTWFVGSVRQATAIEKMRPLLGERATELSDKLPRLQTGHFQVLRDGGVQALRADVNLVQALQLSQEEILSRAAAA
jgi:Cdc6-like AAA superfamily ATPase/energy-coupling factor transporter ATP-binding protein EcfA2